jgi:hypothetical protein
MDLLIHLPEGYVSVQQPEGLLQRIASRAGPDHIATRILRYCALAVAAIELTSPLREDAFTWLATGPTPRDYNPVERVLYLIEPPSDGTPADPTADDALIIAFDAARDFDAWLHVYSYLYDQSSPADGWACGVRAVESLHAARAYPDGLALLRSLAADWHGTADELDAAVAGLGDKDLSS